MEAFLAAVKKSLFVLLGVTLVVLVLSLPRPANRPLIGALNEVTAFRAAFTQSSAEQLLRGQAESRGALALSALESAAKGKRGPRLMVAADARPVRPLSSVSLATLEQVEAHAQPSTITTGVPDAEALASSILWRLARTEQSGPFTLSSVEVSRAALSDKDIALEREVAALRLASLEARAAVESTEARMPTLEQRVEFQSKNRSKYLGKSIMALKEGRDLLAVQQKTHADTQARYDQAARSADSAKQPVAGVDVPKFGLARVVVNTGASARTFAIPVPLTIRQVPVNALPTVSFARTHATGLWDEVKAQDAATAIETIRGHFNWHMHRVPAFGLELVGAHLLQLLPCILPFLLALVLRHIRRARTSYNPFTTEVPEQAPRIGLRNRLLEFLVVLLLPVLAVGSGIAALLLVGQVPAIPALCLLACLVMGTSAFRELEELREQTLSIVRSHSNLPPAPTVAKL